MDDKLVILDMLFEAVYPNRNTGNNSISIDITSGDEVRHTEI